MWLITGGSGLLGSALRKELEQTAISFLAPSSADLDITNSAHVRQAFNTNDKIDLVIHAAAFTNVDACIDTPGKASLVNTVGTFNIAEQCKLRRIPLIHISTDYVFGDEVESHSETDPHHPLNVYGLTKSHAEDAVRSLLPNSHVIVRTASLYGEGKGFVSSVVALALAGQPVTVPHHRLFSPTPARGLARLLVDVALSPSTLQASTLHLTAQGSVSHFGLAQRIVELMGSRVAVEVNWGWVDRAVRPRVSVLSNSSSRWLLRSWEVELARHLPELIDFVNPRRAVTRLDSRDVHTVNVLSDHG